MARENNRIVLYCAVVCLKLNTPISLIKARKSQLHIILCQVVTLVSSETEDFEA